jgi:SnoaL-like domain
MDADIARASAADHQAITDVMNRYCRSMDRIDARLGYSVWHEDGMADYGSVFTGTGHGFIDWVCAFHRTLLSHHHQVGNALIAIDGDRAGSESYVTVDLLRAEGDRRVLRTGRGRYLDDWSRRDGRWALERRRFVLNFVDEREVQVDMGWGSRDASDPSYPVLDALGSG